MSVKTVKLSVNETITFNLELQELLIDDQISFGVCWELVQLKEKTLKTVKRFRETRLKVFEKYGKCTDKEKQEWTFEGMKDGEKGKDEVNILLDKLVEFPNELEMKDFKDLKSKIPYIQIMKFFK